MWGCCKIRIAYSLAGSQPGTWVECFQVSGLKPDWSIQTPKSSVSACFTKVLSKGHPGEGPCRPVCCYSQWPLGVVSGTWFESPKHIPDSLRINRKQEVKCMSEYSFRKPNRSLRGYSCPFFPLFLLEHSCNCYCGWPLAEVGGIWWCCKFSLWYSREQWQEAKSVSDQDHAETNISSICVMHHLI